MICKKCQQDKVLSDFYIRSNRKKRPQSYCKDCFNSYCKDRWQQRKHDAITYKGGKCVDCGIVSTTNNYFIFDFHHLDPNKKDFTWAKCKLRKWESVLLELDKCILLCSNCHRIRHYKSGTAAGT